MSVFDGPSCSPACDREVGHTGEHRRDPAAEALHAERQWVALYIAAHRSDAVGQAASRAMSRRARIADEWTEDELNAALRSALAE